MEVQREGRKEREREEGREKKGREVERGKERGGGEGGKDRKRSGYISNQQRIPACASMKLCLEASGKDAIYLWMVQLGFPFKSLSWLIIY